MPAPVINANPVEVILQSYDQRINIAMVDSVGDPVDATYLHLKVLDTGKVVIYEDDYFSPPTPPTRIVKTPGTTGQYSLNWGDSAVPSSTETTTVRDVLFVWRGIGGTGTEPSVILQVVKIVDPLVLMYLPQFRLQIDKAAKLVDENANNFLGYTDAQLLMYLEGGINIINGHLPFPTSIQLENWPFDTQGQLLIDTATLVALKSQMLFAIDSDTDQLSDQGYNFSINHFQKLNTVVSALQAQLDRSIPNFKLSFASYGSILIQAGPSFRLSSLLSAAPSGILFRGYLST